MSMSETYNSSKEAKKIIAEIINHCKEIGLKVNEKGYLTNFDDNLIETIKNWDDIKIEMKAGQGNELREDKETAKFKAVHSSSALCVNTFAPFKQQKESFSFLGFEKFIEASFEKKVPTGISTPNLDFYLENNETIVGFESKFTEFITTKKPNKNLNKYFNREELKNVVGKEFNSLIGEYSECTEKYHLDIAQLIKHAIGLIKQAYNKKPVLVYIYWQPENWYNFKLFQKHNEEINEFGSKINKHIEFKSISYPVFWKIYENDKTFGKHMDIVKTRYNLSL